MFSNGGYFEYLFSCKMCAHNIDRGKYNERQSATVWKTKCYRMKDKVLPYERQSATVWKTKCYRMKDKVLPYERQSATVWKTKCYRMKDKVLPYKRQSATVWKTKCYRTKRWVTQSVAAAIQNLMSTYSEDVDPCKQQIEPSNRDTKRTDLWCLHKDE